MAVNTQDKGRKAGKRLINNALVGAALAAGLSASSMSTQAANVYQMYYVPIPEQEATTFNTVLAGSGTSATARTVVSISVVLPNTIIYFDHSEDDYETDITNPVASSTEIWGDGNPDNGFHPDFPDDVFEAGDVLILDQFYNVNTGVLQSTNQFEFENSSYLLNGGDRFGSNKALAVTRIFYNTPTPGTIMAGSVEVEAVSYWGQEYVLPIGLDTPTGRPQANSPFEHVQAFVQVSEPDTSVLLNGAPVAGSPFAQGATVVINSASEGDRITASAPIQVNLLTGDILTSGGAKESRWYRIPSLSSWADDYYSPVGTTSNSNPARYYVFNPHPTDAINITVEYLNAGVLQTQTIANVGAGASAYLNAPTSSGLRFHTEDGDPFYVMAVVDAHNNGDTYDWGFSLVPAAGLTGQTVVGWAPAYENPAAGATSPTNHVQAGPVWVTTVDTTTVCVDYDRDGVIDRAFELPRLGSALILDNHRDGFDNDMTGTLIYSINDTNGDNQAPAGHNPGNDPIIDRCYSSDDENTPVADMDTQTDIAVVWGQNPNTATTGAPALDAGTTVLAVPKYGVSKRVAPLSEAGVDADSSGTITPGDTIVWFIEVDNYGALPLMGGDLADHLPEGVEFNEAASHSGWDCDSLPCTLSLPPIPPFTSVEFALAATIPDRDGATTSVLDNRVTFTPPGGEEEPIGADASSPVQYVDVTTTANTPPVYEPGGSDLAVTVNFGNAGTRNANVQDDDGLTYRVVIGAGGWTPESVTCEGVQCSYDPATGTVTFQGLPPSLSPSQYTDEITLIFAPPPSDTGPITVTSSISTDDHQPDDHLPDSDTRIIQPLGAPEVDVTTTITPPAAAQINQPVTVPVTFTNYGSEPANITSYELELPTEGVSAVSCDPDVGCVYDPDTGIVTVGGGPSTLPPGDSFEFDLIYTPTEPRSYPVRSLINPSNETENVLPNEANGVTVVTTGTPQQIADVTVAINPPATANAGQPVNVPVTFSNVGPVIAESVSYQVTVPYDLGSVSCTSACTAVYASGVTTITWTGLPESLNSGDAVPTSFTYTAPVPPTLAPLTINQTATIGTDSDESNYANNTAQAPTVIVPADMSVRIEVPPSVIPGDTVEGRMICTSEGPAAALNAWCEVDGLPPSASFSCTPTTPVASLEPGDEIVCDFSFEEEGPITLTGTTGADNDGDPTNNEDEGSLQVQVIPPRPIPAVSPLSLLLVALGLLAVATRRGFLLR